MNTPHTRPARVSVPITPEVHEAFKALGVASGMSTAKVMAEWLQDTIDAARYHTKIMEEARSRPGRATVQAYSWRLSEETDTLLDQIRKGSRAAGAGDAQRPGTGSSGPLTPPSSNTGGKVPKKPNQTKRGTR
jgi:hypothetical protein